MVASCIISFIGSGIAPGSENIYRLIASQTLIGVGFAAVPITYVVPSEILPRRWRSSKLSHRIRHVLRLTHSASGSSCFEYVLLNDGDSGTVAHRSTYKEECTHWLANILCIILILLSRKNRLTFTVDSVRLLGIDRDRHPVRLPTPEETHPSRSPFFLAEADLPRSSRLRSPNQWVNPFLGRSQLRRWLILLD